MSLVWWDCKLAEAKPLLSLVNFKQCIQPFWVPEPHPNMSSPQAVRPAPRALRRIQTSVHLKLSVPPPPPALRRIQTCVHLKLSAPPPRALRLMPSLLQSLAACSQPLTCAEASCFLSMSKNLEYMERP